MAYVVPRRRLRNMRPLLAAVLFATALVGSPRAQDRPFIMPWYSIGASGYGLGLTEAETIVVSMVRLSSATTFWIAERWRHESNALARTASTKHQWIDGRKCPALVDALNKLSDLPASRFGTPDSLADTGLAFDATLTSLRGPPAEKDGVGVWITRREYDGPLTTWRLATEAALDPCWRDEKIQIEGAEVQARLGSEQEARDWRP